MSCTSTVARATLFEFGMYLGINLQDILYGIELLLYLRTMGIFFARRRQPHKSDIFYATLSTAMLILITIWVAALSSFGQKMWLLHRDYPGGPMAYHTKASSSLFMVVGRFSLCILQQLTDALMIYRCQIVWGTRRVIIVPSILWLINIGLGIALDWSSSIPGNTFFSGLSVKLGMVYYSSSTVLNVILTGMICYRLLCHARTVKVYLGERHASPYLAIVALVIHSVLPFTLSSIVFLITHGMGSQSTVVFSFIHPLMMCISPQMLILRVANAEAWQKEESAFPASIVRAPLSLSDDTSSPGRLDGNEIRSIQETWSNARQQSSRKDDQSSSKHRPDDVLVDRPVALRLEPAVTADTSV